MFRVGSWKDGAFGAWREAWAVSAAMANYRKGFAGPARPRTTRATWTTEPVVLVHGLGHNDGAWSTLGARLGAVGFFDFTPVTYGLTDEVPLIAARVGDRVDALLGSRSVQRVHLVGHSLGGVAIRYWHDMLGGNVRADAVVTLGSPHLGTIWTHLPFLSAPARDLALRSSVTTNLRARGMPHDRWTTIGGTFDLLVPAWRTHLPGAVNVNVRAGHVGLLTSRAAAGPVCMALLHAEEMRTAAHDGMSRPRAARQDAYG